MSTLIQDAAQAIEYTTSAHTRSKESDTVPFKRLFTTDIQGEVLDHVNWEKRDAAITSDSGKVIFQQRNVQVPKEWSQTATNIVASKYFYGAFDSEERESSVGDMVERVAKTITGWGVESGFWENDENQISVFEDELTYLLVHQYASFNSPVWFNVGVSKKPQCSACFINSVEDTMESIMDLATREALLFKWGSGTGSNLSTLRSSKEGLTGGGVASGPVSFMRGYDSFANIIKSGGKTRRAAKMIVLNADHPDIVDFINCKADEERKAWALIDAGYNGALNGEAYSSVSFQNANHSIRVTDEFMNAVVNNETYWTKSVTHNEPVEELRALEIIEAAASAAHQCGDPGIQYDDTINYWNPCKTSGRINASNPCSEYVFLDDTACNLASINLMKFYEPEYDFFDAEKFAHACRILITAQEFIVGNSSYPSSLIAFNSRRFRPLGLGFTNLGALLMARGLPYDSDEGRAFAAAITSIMTGEAYKQSAIIARSIGPFEGYQTNMNDFANVIQHHWAANDTLMLNSALPENMKSAATEAWRETRRLGRKYGFRNAQATVIAPTGTIAFMMDCDTTGVEPELALVKYKNMSDGGFIKIVNKTVPIALRNLNYSEDEIANIVQHIENTGSIEGCQFLRSDHLPIFDCSFTTENSTRSIAPMGHVKMLAAIQPFISGAISKTVNVPEDATIADIVDIYIQAWKMGVKAIAVYRDNSKRIQPLATGKKKAEEAINKNSEGPPDYRRHRLPDERNAISHKFTVGEHEGYIMIGQYPNGSPGEMFVHISKEGSTVSGLMDAVGLLTSIALQSGVPLSYISRKFSHTSFEPSGWSGNPDIGFASSILDYVFRWMGEKFNEEKAEQKTKIVDKSGSIDSPPCQDCGALTVRNGTCYQCPNCGETSGCS